MQKKNNLEKERYDFSPLGGRSSATDFRGDFSVPKNMDGSGSIHGSEVSISGLRARGDYDNGRRRRIDDYDYNRKSDPIGWNALIDEGCKAWESVLAEFLGVLVLVFLGCGSCVNWGKPGEPSVVQIAFAFGTARATIATAIGHISGTHVNPAVTIGLCIGKKIKPAKALFYIVFQVLGAITGASILNVIVPDSLNDPLGQTHPNPSLAEWQAVIVEAVITFMLTVTVFAVCDELRNDIKGSAPLMIGFVIMTCHLMAVPFTGSSMNPARSTGPAVIRNNFRHLWIYWLGPCLGSITAGILYVSILHKEEIELIQDARKTRTAPEPDSAEVIAE